MFTLRSAAVWLFLLPLMIILTIVDNLTNSHIRDWLFSDDQQ